MPYDKNDELPESIRKVLPSEAQTIFRKAFNAAIEDNKGDEEKAVQAAWSAVKNAGYAKSEDGQWQKQTKDAKTHEFDAEIFSVGTWNGDKYTEADLEDMVTSFAALKGEIKPPVKLGHNKAQMQDGNPALGWVTALRKVGDKLIATLSQVPDILYRAIKVGRYKRVSSEVFWNFKSAAGRTFKRVLSGVALLGADIPAVSNLEDLEAYLTQSIPPEGSSFERVGVYSFATNEHGILIDQKGDEIVSDELKKEYEDKLKAEKDARVKAEAEAQASNAKLAAYEKKQAAEKQKTLCGTIKAFCEDMVKAFKMTPKGRDIIVQAIEGEAHVYTEKTGFAVPFEVLQRYVETHAKVIQVGEKAHAGKDGGNQKEYADAGAEVDAKAKAYATEHKVAYVQAVASILQDDADLAGRYRNLATVDNESD